MARGTKHVGRSQAGKDAYIQGVKGTALGGTVPEKPNASSTAEPLPPPDETVFTPSKTSVRRPGFWEKHSSDIVKGVIATLVTAAVVSIIGLLLGLRGDVSETKEAVNGLKDRTKTLEERQDRIRDEINRRVDTQLDRFQARIDGLVGNTAGNPRPAAPIVSAPSGASP